MLQKYETLVASITLLLTVLMVFKVRQPILLSLTCSSDCLEDIFQKNGT